MDHAAAFLRAIRAAPDDDGPRLIYADWLDEHGDTDRGAFLRVQCELAKLGPADPRYSSLHLAAQDLLTANEAKWLAPLPAAEVEGVCFRRGFLDAITLDAPTFVRNCDALFHVGAPALCFRAEPGGLRVPLPILLACPYFPRIRRLAFLGAFFHDGGPADEGHWGPDAWQTEHAIRRLLASPSLGPLTSLRLTDLHTLTPGGVRVIAESKRLSMLRELDLSMDEGLTANDVGDEGAELLAGSPHLAGLTSLELYGSGLTDSGLAVLAQSPHLTRLTRLNVGFNPAGDAGITALAQSPNLDTVRELGLDQMNVTAEGARALARSPHVRELRRLDLGFNPIGDAGVEALGRSPWLEQLTTLEVGDESIGEDGLTALAAGEGLPRLTRLHLGYPCRFRTDYGVRVLAAGPLIARLTDLDFGTFDLAPDDLIPLARSPHVGRLRSLGLLWGRGVATNLARALASNAELSGLRSLALCGWITESAVRAVLDTPWADNLTTLRLMPPNPGVVRGCLFALAASDRLSSLTTLDLGTYFLDDFGAEILASSGLDELRRLGVRRAHLTHRGYQFLSERFGPRFRLLRPGEAEVADTPGWAT